MHGNERRAACGSSGSRPRGLALTFSMVSVVAWCGVACAQPLELIVNGQFSQGAVGWVPAVTGNGNWFLATVGAATPLTGLPTSAGGGGDGFYALADAGGNGTRALLQTFNVSLPNRQVILSFDMFVNDWANTTIFDPTQHARVDLMTATSASFDTGSGVLFNAYLGTDGGPLPNEFLHYEFDISPHVAAGGLFKIRFYETDTLNVLNVGVDNVSVRMVPEPGTWVQGLMAALGAFGWFAWRRGEVNLRHDRQQRRSLLVNRASGKGGTSG